MTQLVDLLNLDSDVQEALLFLQRVERERDPLTGRELRAVVAEVEWERQRVRVEEHCSFRTPRS